MRSVLLAILCLGVVSASAGRESRALAAPSDAAPVKPWLGVGIEQGYRGVRIVEVVPDTPADIVGLVLGDEVVAINGQVVRTPDQLISTIEVLAIGEEVELGVLRGGHAIAMRAELTGMLDEQELLRRRLVDRPAPDFSLPVITGSHSGRLSELGDKVVILEFWSTWCTECVATFQPLAAFEAQHVGDVAVLGITGSDTAAVQSFLQKNTPGITLLEDSRGTTQAIYRSQKAPTTVVIGMDGVVRFADIGAHLNIEDTIFAARRALKERRTL